MADFPSTATLIGMVQAFVPDVSLAAAPLFPEATTLNRTYEFDIVTGNRGKTIYRNPDGEAGVIAVTSRTRKEITLPTLREKKTLKESTIRWMDAPGAKAPEKALQAIAREFADLDDIFERTHEYARWQLLTTGLITLTGDYAGFSYDFGLANEATAGTIWTTVGSSTPIANLIAWRTQVEQACGIRPTECWMSDTAIRLVMESTSALAVVGETVKAKYAADGTVLKLADMTVIPYNGGYRDSAGDFKYYMSTDGAGGDMVIIKVPGPVGVTAQGAVVDAKAPDGHTGKFAKSWETEDPSARWILEAQTALPGITNINNFGCYTIW